MTIPDYTLTKAYATTVELFHFGKHDMDSAKRARRPILREAADEIERHGASLLEYRDRMRGLFVKHGESTQIAVIFEDGTHGTLDAFELVLDEKHWVLVVEFFRRACRRVAERIGPPKTEEAPPTVAAVPPAERSRRVWNLTRDQKIAIIVGVIGAIGVAGTFIFWAWDHLGSAPKPPQQNATITQAPTINVNVGLSTPPVLSTAAQSPPPPALQAPASQTSASPARR